MNGINHSKNSFTIVVLIHGTVPIYEDIFVYTVSHSSSQLQARFPLLTFSNASLPSLKAK